MSQKYIAKMTGYKATNSDMTCYKATTGFLERQQTTPPTTK